MKKLVLTSLLLALAASSTFAQQFVGGVRGLVQDPGGAVIPSATVTLKNEASGTVTTKIGRAHV